MKTVTLTMRLIKEHKVLAQYAEINEEGNPKVVKALVQPIYLRKSEILDSSGDLPMAFNVTFVPIV